MVRLYLLVENTLSSATAKMLCGARYLDTNAPVRLVTRASRVAAEDAMRNHGRLKSIELRWGKSKDIRENVRFTLAAVDPFHATVTKYGGLLTEMRKVRNQIAHANSRTRKKYRDVITKHYGGLKRGVSPGLLLLTDAFGPRCLLETYVVSSRVFIKDLLRVY